MRALAIASLLAAVCTGAVGCRGTPPVRGQSMTLALDTASHGHLRMAAGRVEFREDGREPERALAVDIKYGAPADAAIDPGFGIGALAFERALFCVDAQVLPPAPVQCESPGFAIRRVAIVGRRLVATGKDRVAMYVAQDDDDTRWVLQDWCWVPRRMQRIDLAIPWGEQDYAAVGLVDGEPAVVRVTRREGSWNMLAPFALEQINEIAAVRNLGDRLVVFGRRIRTPAVSAAGPPQMSVQIRGYTVDVASMMPQPTMEMDKGGGAHVEVTDLALSAQHAVVVVDDRFVKTYAIVGGELRWAEGASPRLPRDVDVEWVGGNMFHRYEAGSAEPVPMPLEVLQ